jgi:predicted Zn-dependent protease
VYAAALKRDPSIARCCTATSTCCCSAVAPRDVLADLDERLRTSNDDARLYELQARAYEATGRPISQHRAQAEALYRRGMLQACGPAARNAVKLKGSDFYELSSAESRLRELRAALEIERAAEKALKIT